MGRDEYNEALRAAGVDPWRLKQGDFSQLRPLGPTRSSGGQPAEAELPSIGAVKGRASRLLASEEPLDYLTEVRGLSLRTVEKFNLGWDGTHLTFPVLEKGKLANVRRRLPRAGAKVRGLRGRGSQLYPDVPPGGPLLLVAGEFDALIGRQMGLPTVTTTVGATLPEPLAEKLAGRRVAVMYDVGEEGKAAKTVSRLLATGAEEAWVVRLAKLGLPPGGDLNSAYLSGVTVAEILALINREAAEARS